MSTALSSPPGPGRAAVRILNVDADPAFRLAKSAYLTAQGFDVLDAATGTEALALADRFNPELVLLDIDLPDLDGYAVCERLRNVASGPAIILQIMAMRASPEDWRKSLEAAADSYVIQPSQPWVLLRTIRSVLNRRTVCA